MYSIFLILAETIFYFYFLLRNLLCNYMITLNISYFVVKNAAWTRTLKSYALCMNGTLN